MLILFLIPGTPKDLLVYLAGLLPINPVRFLLISTLARIPSVISSTLTGSTIITGNWHIGNNNVCNNICYNSSCYGTYEKI